MQGVFDLLASQDVLQVVRRDVGTPAELQYYAKKMCQGRYKHFKVVHLAFHGRPGHLAVGDEHLELTELAELLGDACKGRVVHFGACSTMRVGPDRLAEFREATGASAVSGYTKDVGWIESCAFEVLLIHALTHYKTPSAAFRYVERTAGDLQKRLGWHRV